MNGQDQEVLTIEEVYGLRAKGNAPMTNGSPPNYQVGAVSPNVTNILERVIEACHAQSHVIHTLSERLSVVSTPMPSALEGKALAKAIARSQMADKLELLLEHLLDNTARLEIQLNCLEI